MSKGAKSVGKDSGVETKLFVVDTNVLMHDPTSLFRFEEHDVYVPMATLEELDRNKQGHSDVARNARQASRFLDEVVSFHKGDIKIGVELKPHNGGNATGRLFLQTEVITDRLPSQLVGGSADNQIIGVVKYLQRVRKDRQVVLVSKDINMRIKARALGLQAEDYFNDKVLEDTDLLYTGVLSLPADFWETHGKDMESWKEGDRALYRLRGPLAPTLHINQFVYDDSVSERPFYALVHRKEGGAVILRTTYNYASTKRPVWGITARNREQNFAFNLLMDPDVDFVTLVGQAGTGKTLLALAAGLAQVLDDRRYTEIIVTRVTVPIGEDIGFLPGTEEEKMTPWMGAFQDNLEVLNGGGEHYAQKEGESPLDPRVARSITLDQVRSHVKMKSLNFMRGRTFLGKFLIIDEAQNLTPKQMKTLITRAGPGTKVVCLGNIAQIDTPYLTEGSSGLTYVVDRFKGWAHSGHVTLARGERSRLADHAGEVL